MFATPPLHISSQRPARRRRGPQLVIFDIDGTLVDSTEADALCSLEAFRACFGDADEGLSRSTRFEEATHIGVLSELCLRRFGRTPSALEIAKLEQAFVERLETHLRSTPLSPVPGAAALVRHLAARREWQVALVSGGFRASARLKLERAGIPHADLPGAFCNDALKRTDILREAIARAREVANFEDFDRVVYVGDGVWDLRAAQALGLEFVGVAQSLNARHLRDAGARSVLGDFLDLAQVFSALSQVPGPTHRCDDLAFH